MRDDLIVNVAYLTGTFPMLLESKENLIIFYQGLFGLQIAVSFVKHPTD